MYAKIGPNEEQLIKILWIRTYPNNEIATLVANNFVHKTPICVPKDQSNIDGTFKMVGFSTDKDK